MNPFVFSIRPRHVADLIDGSKIYEYRTRRPSVVRGDTILIYETAPTSMVVATAIVRGLVTGKPAEVWRSTGDRGGITRAEFDAYFRGRDLAVAIKLEVSRLPEPVALPDGQRAPQSWARWRGSWPR